MDHLKIALVSDFYAPRLGGIERHLEGLAAALAARGHAVHVFTTVCGESPSPHPQVVVHRLPYARIEPGGIAVPNFAKLGPFRRMLRAEDVDVVHAHGMFSTLAIGGLLAASTLRVPSVFTLHSLMRPAVLPIARAIFAIWSRRAGIVTAVSRRAALDASRASGRDTVPILPNGIDLARWRGPARESSPGRVVSVMRLVRKKAPGDLLRAIPGVLAALPASAPFRVAVIGDGRERDALQREAHRLGIADHVDWLGALSHDAVRRELFGSSLFALPSPNEAFGLAVLEARCAGLPVVALDDGAIPELVEHGRHGLLVPRGQDMAGAIVRLLQDDALRARMRRASGEGLDPYGWDAVAGRHLEVYRSVIAARRTASRRWSAA